MGITDLLQAAKRGIASPLCHRRKAFGSRSIPTDFRESGQWHVEFHEENGVVIDVGESSIYERDQKIPLEARYFRDV